MKLDPDERSAAQKVVFKRITTKMCLSSPSSEDTKADPGEGGGEFEDEEDSDSEGDYYESDSDLEDADLSADCSGDSEENDDCGGCGMCKECSAAAKLHAPPKKRPRT